MKKFCFVILHYKTSDDTIECIESILRLNEKSEIVVVDNYSNNGSIEIVKKQYNNNNHIHFVLSSKNLGFASGNNVGYKYAKKVLESDFIAVSNNDIVIQTRSLISDVETYYDKEPFYILGPDIESLVDHNHQNPMSSGNTNKRAVSKQIFNYRVLYILSKLHLYDIIKRHKKENRIVNKKNDLSDVIRNTQLHGSFLVFSPSYIKKEDYAFRPGTFLYLEESILYRYCLKRGYSTVYWPLVKVYHKEDSSTNALFKADKEKREFVFRNMIKSLKVYKKLLSNDI